MSCQTREWSVYSKKLKVSLENLFDLSRLLVNYFCDFFVILVVKWFCVSTFIPGKFITSKPYSHVAKLSSLENVKYTSFAKSKHFGADLYHDLVALFYNASLLAETWQHGENLPSNCSVPTVENIKELKFMDISFKEAEDHSKWTISKSEYLGLVCIGDINRMVSTAMKVINLSHPEAVPWRVTSSGVRLSKIIKGPVWASLGGKGLKYIQ